MRVFQPGDRLGPVTAVPSEIEEMVRQVASDPASGGFDPMALRKAEYLAGSRYSWGLALSALLVLGYQDTSEDVAKQLAPAVEEAFERYKLSKTGP